MEQNTEWRAPCLFVALRYSRRIAKCGPWLDEPPGKSLQSADCHRDRSLDL